MKACPFCAEDVQGAAKVCKHCGRDIATPAPKTTARDSKGRQIMLLVLAVIALGFLLNQMRGKSEDSSSQTPHLASRPAPYVVDIASTSDIDIPAGGMERFDWTVPQGQPNCHVTGHIEVTSGGAKDVQVFITTGDEYKNLQNGHAAHSYLGTDKTTVVNLDVQTGAAGPMVLAIANRFSLLTGKRVQLREVRAVCT